ncbi:MAG TPA: hypothetical protein PK014_13710 [Thermoanaerobaculia bacterium]|nr:hypothetical protein [Thermoanaerobaculia bacterium]HUM31096.1 hypothetical protein [Thermoanaerobaculia bacterium]HXK69452.1 hypothetical protein [Thermoanaerobaculia bacterium]
MKKLFLFFLLACGAMYLFAAVPPGLINYQGVLRDDAGEPLDGSYDMVFTFYSDAAAGDEILIDSHLAAGSGAVTVSDGLFSVALGSGTVTDGSGAGTYTSLGLVFADYNEVWLQVNVEGEDLSPRVRVTASAYAQNAGSLEGETAADLHDWSNLTSVPAGFADNVDDTGLTAETDPEVDLSTIGAVPRWDGSALSEGLIFDDGMGVDIGTQSLPGTLNVTVWNSLQDQAQTQDFNEAYYSRWQSFTAGMTGYLTKISISLSASSGHVITVNIHEGTGTGGALLASKSVTMTEAYNGWYEFRFSSPPWVTAGQIYTISEIPSQEWSYWRINDVNSYSGGISSVSATMDFTFKTYVSSGTFAGLYVGDPGAVGIGTRTPEEMLSVTGTIQSTSGGFKFPDGTVQATAAGDSWSLDADDGHPVDALYVDAVGSVGIGTTTPEWTLSVAGDETLESRLKFTLADGYGGNDAVIGVDAGAGKSLTFYDYNAAKSLMKIVADTGNVGIGTLDPTHRLTVAGGNFNLQNAAGGGRIYAYVDASDHGGMRFYDQSAVYQVWIGIDTSDKGFVEADDFYNVKVSDLHAGKEIRYSTPTGPEPLIQFRGTAALVNGAATISIPDHLREMADLSSLSVYLTPRDSSSPGLAWTASDDSTISVQELEEGKGSYSFDWFAIATRKGRENYQVLQNAEPDGMDTGDQQTAAERTISRVKRAEEARDLEEPKARVDAVDKESTTGTVDASNHLDSVGSQDRRLVEPMAAAYPVEAGDILVFNPANGEELYLCSTEADPMVVGVAAENGEGTIQTVVSGVTLVKADASMVPIRRGDLLVTSPLPGHATKMKAFVPGTVIGKALEPLDTGTGMIKVLVMVR